VKSEIAHSLTRRMKMPLLRPLKSLVTRRLTPVWFVPPSCDCERRHHDVGRDFLFWQERRDGMALVEKHGVAVHPHDPLETFFCWLHHLAHE
jgi:hypothetical protein